MESDTCAARVAQPIEQQPTLPFQSCPAGVQILVIWPDSAYKKKSRF